MTFSPVTDFSQLWNWCEYPLASNNAERARFVRFMTSGTRTPAEVQADFERSVKRWLLQQSRLPPRRQRDSDSTREDTINVLADRIASSSDNRVSRGADTLDSEAPDPETELHWRVCTQCVMTTARSVSMPSLRSINIVSLKVVPDYISSDGGPTSERSEPLTVSSFYFLHY